MNKYFWNQKWSEVKAYFNPRQKWLTKVIPNTWADKTWLVPNLLFAILIDFVEEEKGLSQLDINWDEERAFVSDEYIKEVMTSYGELKEAYEYLKNEREALKEAHANSYPEIVMTDKGMTTKEPFEIAYAENNRIEAELKEKDMKTMMTIVKHYEILWT